MGIGYRTEQSPRRQLHYFPFPQGQIGVPDADRGNDGMMVADFLAVAYLFGKDGFRRGQTANGGSSGDIGRDAGSHIVGEIPAVRPGIGAELLFIQGLKIIQYLLCGIAQDAIGIPL